MAKLKCGTEAEIGMEVRPALFRAESRKKIVEIGYGWLADRVRLDGETNWQSAQDLIARNDVISKLSRDDLEAKTRALLKCARTADETLVNRGCYVIGLLEAIAALDPPKPDPFRSLREFLAANGYVQADASDLSRPMMGLCAGSTWEYFKPPS